MSVRCSSQPQDQHPPHPLTPPTHPCAPCPSAPQNGSQLGPVLRNLSPSPYLLFSTSPDSRFLAVVCANKEVGDGRRR